VLSTGTAQRWSDATLCTPMVQILVQTTSSVTSSTSNRCNKTWSCKAGAGSHRTGSFFVGAEPFNAQEKQTINNNNTSLALQRLDVRVYDLTGSPALISTALYFVVRMKSAEPEKNNCIDFFTLYFSRDFRNDPRDCGKVQSDDTATVLAHYSKEHVPGKLPLGSFSIEGLYYII
jgi:hypothetical protein